MNIDELAVLFNRLDVILGVILVVAGLGAIFIIRNLQLRLREVERKLGWAEAKNDGLTEKIEMLEASLAPQEEEVRQFLKAKELARVGPTIWEKPPEDRFDDYDERLRRSIPIITFANLKGGVGKTTLATNLSAYFAMKKGEKVLAIDLDYQGSMSGLFLSQVGSTTYPEVSKDLINGTLDGSATISSARQVTGCCPDLYFIPTFYELESEENRLMFQWFLGDTDQDVRYALAKVLLSDAVQQTFDKVIIDAPPRLTTGLMNALCSSTHLLIPTVLDSLSAETVENFSSKLTRLREEVLPHLEFAGIMGTLTRQSVPSTRERAAALDAQNRARAQLGPSIDFLWDAILPRSAQISNTVDNGIPYCQSGSARELFDGIGEVVSDRLR